MKLTLAIIVCIGLYTASASPSEKPIKLDEEYREILQRAEKYALLLKTEPTLILRMLEWCKSEYADDAFKTKCTESFGTKCAPRIQRLHPSDSWKNQAAYEILTEQITMLSFGDDGTSELKRVNIDYAGVSICSFCLYPLSEDGKHFIVATKCGHIFGDSCIREFLSRFPGNSGECPTCSEKLGLDDLWQLYDKNVVVFDQDERNQLQKRLEALNHEKNMLKTLGITYCECKSCNLSFKCEAELNRHQTQKHRSSSH